MADEGPREGVWWELAFLAGMLLLAYPVFSAVASLASEGGEPSFGAAVAGYLVVLAVCFAYYRVAGGVMGRLHSAEPPNAR